MTLSTDLAEEGENQRLEDVIGPYDMQAEEEIKEEQEDPGRDVPPPAPRVIKQLCLRRPSSVKTSNLISFISLFLSLRGNPRASHEHDVDGVVVNSGKEPDDGEEDWDPLSCPVFSHVEK